MSIKPLLSWIFRNRKGKAIYWQKEGKEFVGFECKNGKIISTLEVTNTEELLKDLKINISI